MYINIPYPSTRSNEKTSQGWGGGLTVHDLSESKTRKLSVK